LEFLATGWSVGSVVAAAGRLEFLATGWSVGSVVAAAGRLEFLATGWIVICGGEVRNEDGEAWVAAAALLHLSPDVVIAADHPPHALGAASQAPDGAPVQPTRHPTQQRVVQPIQLKRHTRPTGTVGWVRSLRSTGWRGLPQEGG
jgi:hypothetical protein